MNSARARAIPGAIAVVALALAAGAPRTAASAPNQAAAQATPAVGVLDRSTAPFREREELQRVVDHPRLVRQPPLARWYPNRPG